MGKQKWFAFIIVFHYFLSYDMFAFIREAAQQNKVLFLVARPLRTYPAPFPRSSLVATFFDFFSRASKNVLLS